MFIYCMLVFVLSCVTDLKSSEDSVRVYVILGTDEHGWRRGGVTVIAGCMATAGQE